MNTSNTSLRRGNPDLTIHPKWVDFLTCVQDRVIVFTDGACSGNPGRGGYAGVLLYNDECFEVSGGENYTTNNRMEMLGAIESLGLFPTTFEFPVHIFTDSKYLQNGIQTWIKAWKKNNWMTSAKKPVKNQDLWIRLDTLCQTFTVEWSWVKGHSHHYFNDRADALARNALIAQRIQF